MTDPVTNITDRPLDDADKAVEWELIDHFRQELEPYQGQARAAFEAAVVPERRSKPIRKRRVWWVSSGFGLAAAAALAVGFWMSPDLLETPTGTTGNVGSTGAPIASDGGSGGGVLNADWSPTNVARQELWRTQDAGQVLIDGQPANAVLNERWQTTQFTDADGYNVTITLPDHDLVFVNVGDE